MRSARRVVVAAVIAVTTSATTLVAAPEAMAAPGNCTISYPAPSEVASLCTTGTGHQRIDLVIYQADAGENAVEGNWAAVGQYSTVYTSWTVLSAWVELSNS